MTSNTGDIEDKIVRSSKVPISYWVDPEDMIYP